MENQTSFRLRSSLQFDFIGQAKPLDLAQIPTNSEALKAVCYQRKVEKISFPAAIRKVASIVSSLKIPGFVVERCGFVVRRLSSLFNKWQAILKHKKRNNQATLQQIKTFEELLKLDLDCLESVELPENEEPIDEPMEIDGMIQDCEQEVEKIDKKACITTPAVVQVLERTGISNRNASMLFGALIQDNHTVSSNYALHPTSILRGRMKFREEFSKQIKENFKPGTPLTIHWDGKLLPNNVTGVKEDRLPILVTGSNVSKLLSVPVVERGSAILEAEAIYETVLEWGLIDLVVAMSFDTTNVNAGVHNGVIIRLPKLLNKKLIPLACRHHVAELVMKHTYEAFSETSKSNELDEFKKFQSKYNDNELYKNITKFKTIKSSSKMSNIASPWKDDVIEFCQLQLKDKQPRGDYRELLELSIIFLGGVPPKGVKFRRAGSLSRARWMGRVIYILKSWIVRDTVKVFDSKAMLHFGNMCLFITQCYIKYWYQVNIPIIAPRLDLEFYRAIKSFHIEGYVAVAAKSFTNHLWYLSEYNVGLAFFDCKVSEAEKIRMVENLKRSPRATDGTATIKAVSLAENAELASFVSPKTLDFFEILGISTKFLSNHPNLWNEDAEYQSGVRLVEGLQVVNDVAERAVKLITEFNQKVTKDPVQQQYLLQVVEHHRREFPLKN